MQVKTRELDYTLLLGGYEFLGFTLTITPDRRFLLLAWAGEPVAMLSIHTSVRHLQELCENKLTEGH